MRHIFISFIFFLFLFQAVYAYAQYPPTPTTDLEVPIPEGRPQYPVTTKTELGIHMVLSHLLGFAKDLMEMGKAITELPKNDANLLRNRNFRHLESMVFFLHLQLSSVSDLLLIEHLHGEKEYKPAVFKIITGNITLFKNDNKRKIKWVTAASARSQDTLLIQQYERFKGYAREVDDMLEKILNELPSEQ